MVDVRKTENIIDRYTRHWDRDFLEWYFSVQSYDELIKVKNINARLKRQAKQSKEQYRKIKANNNRYKQYLEQHRTINKRYRDKKRALENFKILFS